MQVPIFYSAMMLTGVNLLLRMAGTSFQVYISGRIGAAGVGLLQLVISVGNLATVAGIAGIRTATMYLTAEELGRKRKGNIKWVLSGCFLYCFLCSAAVGTGLYIAAPVIAQRWIGDIRTTEALRLLAVFLPVSCLCGVMSGYFTAANRIGTLAMIEVFEQLCAISFTMAGLHFWAGTDSGKACQAVILGGSAGVCLTLGCLLYLHLRNYHSDASPIPIRSRLLQAAVPLAAADVVKSGISTTENLMVPKRLARNPRIADPLAAFGMVGGMVFPVLMFPACILFGLAELLIPEMARCKAAGSRRRISYLMHRSLRISMLYGAVFSGLLFLLAEPLCLRLYRNADAGRYLRFYAPLIPVLYCDAITDAMTKGLGEQKVNVRYNIFTSALDALFLFILLPGYGMAGYFISFLLTHLLNFALSIRHLIRITGETLSLWIPLQTGLCTTASAWAASHILPPPLRAAAFLCLLASTLWLSGVIGSSDLHWLRGLLNPGIPHAAAVES